MLGADFYQRGVHIFGHVILIPTNIEVASSIYPIPYFLTILLHQVLDIHFLGALSGPC